MDSLYFDFNATTPVSEEVQDVICYTLKSVWGNPSSSYIIGKEAKKLIEVNRSKVAEMIGAQPKEIIFTSGGTEANNMIIYSSIEQNRIEMLENNISNSLPHIVTTNIEHDSVKLPLEKLVSDKKAEVTFVPVSKSTGKVNTDDILNAIRPNTCFVTVMLANNETGIIQPVFEIGPRLKYINKKRKMNTKIYEPKIYFHSDVAQAIGKIEVNIMDLDIDYVTIVGHKFYGPRIGAIYKRLGCPLHPMLYGGGQEHNYRPGTENVCMIAGLGKASELVKDNVKAYNLQMMNVRDYFEKSLKTAFSNKVIFNNCIENVDRLPNTISVAFDYDNITGRKMLASTKICASTGAACHESGKPSVILTSCGVTDYLAARTLRMSIGKDTKIEDVDKAVAELQRVITELCAKK